MLKKIILCSAFVVSNMLSLVVHASVFGHTSVSNELSDPQIKAKIKTLLMHSPLMNSAKIAIELDKKTVVLSGVVLNDLQYEHAIALAQSVNNVMDINVDKLHVKAHKTALGYTYVTAKIKGVILREKLFENKPSADWPVRVETKNGVVYLSGIVDSAAKQKKMMLLARSISGYRTLHSTVLLKT